MCGTQTRWPRARAVHWPRFPGHTMPRSTWTTTPKKNTAKEFADKLDAAGITLPEDTSAAIVTHCGSGGCGGKGQALLIELGYKNVHNGGGLNN
eukprot:m.167459 g.167459  ORF g.167459 m.167459 type:complete len:94 (-) comp14729_c0_seq4:4332-4613(-)